MKEEIAWVISNRIAATKFSINQKDFFQGKYYKIFLTQILYLVWKTQQ